MEQINKVVPILVAFNIVSMGTIATILAVPFEWGGTCIDVLNVASPAAIWAEVLSLFRPLLLNKITIITSGAHVDHY
jgi:hypothetical protein